MAALAVTARVALAHDRGALPGMIVVGGTAAARHDLVVSYILGLVEAGLLSADDVGWLPESAVAALDVRNVDQHDAASAVWQSMAGTALVVVSELGADADLDWRAASYTERVHGLRPMLVDQLSDDRYNRDLPLVITSRLAAGHRPGSAADKAADRQLFTDQAQQAASPTDGGTVITMTGPDMAARTTLADRDTTGWVIPGPAGFDPDGRIVEVDAPLTLQEYLGEHTWWRLYKNAIGTAIDADAASTPPSP